ncbi:MAG: glycosyl hydrolase 53 family protein [Microbacterium arborescens]
MTHRSRRRATRLAATALTVTAAAVLAIGGSSATAATAAFEPGDLVMGGDLGMFHEVESLGGRFSRDGVPGDPIAIMADAGMNLARLRLWVDPYTVAGEPYGGGTNDLATTIATAQRAKAAGMDILLDFHLSDWWADPGTQTLPKAWRTLSYPQLVTTVRDYTNDVVDRMRAAGVLPDMVQMGNEIPGGILWDHGRVGNGVSDFSQLAELLTAGIAGVEDALAPGEDVEIVLHLDHGGDNALYRWWFDEITARGVPFDVIGLSYYPFWHGTMGELAVNLNDISSRYGKDVLIVETAYGWTLGDGDGLGNSFYTAEEAAGGYPASVAGQTAFLRDLRDIVRSVPGDRGRGLIWWEPGWLPVPGANWGTEAGKIDNDDGVLSNPWDNQTLFDWTGDALATLDVFGETPPVDLAVNGGFEQDGYTNTPTGWGVWSPGDAHANAVFTQDPAVVGQLKLTFWKPTPYTASVYQAFSGLPAGTYRVSAWTLNGGGQNAAYLYAKNGGGPEQRAALPVSAHDWKRISLDVAVTSGALEIGFYTDARSGNWINVDDVRVERVG